MPFLRLGETIYHIPRSPRRISRTAGAVLARTLDVATPEAVRRIKNANRLAAVVDQSPRYDTIRPFEGALPGYLRFPIVQRVDDSVNRTDEQAVGIVPGYPKALCDLGGFAEHVDNLSCEFPGARLLAERLITLPTHSFLSERDLAAIVEWVEHQL